MNSSLTASTNNFLLAISIQVHSQAALQTSVRFVIIGYISTFIQLDEQADLGAVVLVVQFRRTVTPS
jgi:hypothetical protein